MKREERTRRFILMKKRLFTVFTLSVFLVGIMAAAAAAASVTINPNTVEATVGTAVNVEITVTNTASSAAVAKVATASSSSSFGASATQGGLTLTGNTSSVSKNGTQTIKLTGTPEVEGTLAFKVGVSSSNCVELTVTVAAASSGGGGESGGGSTRPTKPKFYDSSNKELDAEKAVKLFKTLKYKTDLSGDIVIKASNEVGEITAFTATMDSIAGLSLDVDADKHEATFSGTPTEVVSGKQVTITATSEKGTSTLKFKLNVGFDRKTFTWGTDSSFDKWPQGSYAKNSDIADTPLGMEDNPYTTVISAEPGPVVWKYKNLPAGITATESGSTQLILSGTFSALTQFAKDGTAKKANYQITASNKAMGESITGSADIYVFDKPTINTTSLPDLTVGKRYKAKLAFGNSPTSYDVRFRDTEDGEWIHGKTPDKLTIDKYGDDSATTETTDEGGSLEWSKDDLMISGTLNNVPASGKIYVRVFVGNPAGGMSEGELVTDAEDNSVITKDFTINVKGIAPVLAKPDKTEFSGTTTALNFAITKGTKPISVDAYITATDAKAVGLDEEVKLSNIADDNLGLAFETVEGDAQWNGRLTFNAVANDGNVIKSYKGLKVTLEATNPATGTSTVKKTFAISNNSSLQPTWKHTSAEGTAVSSDVVIETTAAGKLGEADAIALPAGLELASAVLDALTFYADVEAPYTITPASGTKINGLEITHDGRTITITGTPTADKDTTSKIKLVATNTSTKKKAQLNVTISAFAKPEFSNASALVNGKTLTAGKAASIKPKIKVNKKLASNITYSVDDSSEIDSATLTNYAFTLDPDTGAIKTEGAKPTINDSNAYDSTQKLTLVATGNSGYAFGDGDGNKVSQDVKIDVKPLQPKIKTSKIVYTKGTATNTFDIEVSNIAAKDVEAGYADLTYSAEDISDVGGALEDATITMDESAEATKGTAIDVTVSNYGVETTKKITFIVHDAKPVIEASPNSVELTAENDSDVTESVTLTVDSTTATGDSAFKWKITDKPTGVTVKITPESDTRSATVTVTAKKKLKNDVSGTIKVTATNTASKATSDPAEITVSATAAEKEESTKDGEALARENAIDEATEPMKEEDVEVGEGDVILGKARTEEALTDGQRTAIAEAGYIVVAVLPEVEVTAAGQYPFAVEIPEEIAAGKELAWFAFPTKPSEDDEIVDFFDEEGADTEVVPESRKITAYPWLNADVTYAPVIAVKADTGEEGAETEEQIKTIRAVKK